MLLGPRLMGAGEVAVILTLVATLAAAMSSLYLGDSDTN